ncbi:MAG: aromatic acid exporter family protein [Oscillospiraceae bacterium]
MNEKYKIGMRTVKTAIAVFVCLIISFVFHRSNAFYSCIATVVCIQPTYTKTLSLGVHRLIGTGVGGLIGYIVLEFTTLIPYYSDGLYLIIIPIFLILSIYLCNIINRKDATSICCIVFLSIVANSNRDIAHTLMYVIDRMIDTSIGVVVAMIVNRFCIQKK